MANPWNREPDDDADNTDLVIGTCRVCGEPCRVEDDFCPPCWRKQRERNEAIYLEAVRTWFGRRELWEASCR